MALLEQTEECPKSLALWTASMTEGKLAIPLTSLGGKLKAETTRNWACDSNGCVKYHIIICSRKWMPGVGWVSQ